jgi:hypothetical protein
MKVTHKHKIYLDNPKSDICIDVMQGDAYTRILEFSLYSGGQAWNVPAGVAAAVAYSGSGGKGIYDTLPDGSAACTVVGNVVSAVVIPQVLAMYGKTAVTIVLTNGNSEQLATFCVTLDVAYNPAIDTVQPPDYINLRQWMTQELLNDLLNATNRAEQTVSRAENAEHRAEDAAQRAEDAVQRVGDAVQGVEDSERRTMEAAQNAEKVIQRASDAVQRAEDAAQNADEAMRRSERAAQRAENAAKADGTFSFHVELSEDIYWADATMAEIRQAQGAGCPVVCILQTADQGELQLPLLRETADAVCFAAVFAGKAYLVTLTADGVTVEISKSSGGGGTGADYGYLKGLKSYHLGDSIVEIQGTTADPKKFGNWYTYDLQGRDIREITVSGYVQAIESRYGLVATNYGKSGHTLVADYPTLASLNYSDVALVTIAYGVNDARTGVPLGTVNSTDASTFAGALNNLLRKIYTDNPECRVLVLAPLQRLHVTDFGIATPNGNGNYLIDFVNMCKAVAEKRSTAFLDQYRCTGINQTNLYYYTVEGVHPVNQGFARIKNAVIGILDELFALEYEPFGVMTNTGDTEPEEPDVGGDTGGEAPPEGDEQATAVELTEEMFANDKGVSDNWGSPIGGSEFSHSTPIELLAGKTYTFVGIYPSGWVYCTVTNAVDNFEDTHDKVITGSSTEASVVIGGVTYKKVTITMIVPVGKTAYLWINKLDAIDVSEYSLTYV